MPMSKIKKIKIDNILSALNNSPEIKITRFGSVKICIEGSYFSRREIAKRILSDGNANEKNLLALEFSRLDEKIGPQLSQKSSHTKRLHKALSWLGKRRFNYEKQLNEIPPEAASSETPIEPITPTRVPSAKSTIAAPPPVLKRNVEKERLLERIEEVRRKPLDECTALVKGQYAILITMLEPSPYNKEQVRSAAEYLYALALRQDATYPLVLAKLLEVQSSNRDNKNLSKLHELLQNVEHQVKDSRDEEIFMSKDNLSHKLIEYLNTHPIDSVDDEVIEILIEHSKGVQIPEPFYDRLWKKNKFIGIKKFENDFCLELPDKLTLVSLEQKYKENKQLTSHEQLTLATYYVTQFPTEANINKAVELLAHIPPGQQDGQYWYIQAAISRSKGDNAKMADALIEATAYGHKMASRMVASTPLQEAVFERFSSSRPRQAEIDPAKPRPQEPPRRRKAQPKEEIDKLYQSINEKIRGFNAEKKKDQLDISKSIAKLTNELAAKGKSNSKEGTLAAAKLIELYEMHENNPAFQLSKLHVDPKATLVKKLLDNLSITPDDIVAEVTYPETLIIAVKYAPIANIPPRASWHIALFQQGEYASLRQFERECFMPPLGERLKTLLEKDTKSAELQDKDYLELATHFVTGSPRDLEKAKKLLEKVSFDGQDIGQYWFLKAEIGNAENESDSQIRDYLNRAMRAHHPLAEAMIPNKELRQMVWSRSS